MNIKIETKIERQSQIHSLMKKFLNALRNYFYTYKKRRPSSTSSSSHQGYYQQAKKSQTQSRNLIQALKLYIKAIQNREKKDSTIKDFASSLHQLGYTRQAVKFMDDCEDYYDGNKEKYHRLRDNLKGQLRPTGKHQCRYILLDGIPTQLKQIYSQEQLKNTLFKIPKRIKSIRYYSNLDLLSVPCTLLQCQHILVQFQSYSAAKKTLQSFNFQQYFAIQLYWINYKTMKIVCCVIDGKKDFQQGLIIDNQMIQNQMMFLGNQIWVEYAKQVYSKINSNGFQNLLIIHLLKDYEGNNKQKQQQQQDVNEKLQRLQHEYIGQSLISNKEDINKQNLFYQQYNQIKYYTDYDQYIYTHYSYHLNQGNQWNQYQNVYRT